MKISPPSRSVSKSTLFITPLFLCVLALLSTISDVSYLFILQFSENVAGDADLNIISSTMKADNSYRFQDQQIINNLRRQQGLNPQANSTGLSASGMPLVDLDMVDEWLGSSPLVKGASPRWILPVLAGDVSLDSIMLVMDVEREKKIGLGQRVGIQPLKAGQAALSKEVIDSLGLKIGDRLNITFQLQSAMESAKMLTKFTDLDSETEELPKQEPLTPASITPALNGFLQKLNITDYQLTEQDTQKIFDILNQPVHLSVQIVEIVKEQGAWPSALHNVIVIDMKTAAQVIQNTIYESLEKLEKDYSKQIDLVPWIWPYMKLRPNIKPRISQFLNRYCPIAAVSFNHRSIYYRPHYTEWSKQATALFQTSPVEIQIMPLDPLYRTSLAIKYFFDAVMQIFTFIAFLLYINLMRIILKQIYDQKEIQIGVWRTLGIGGVKFQENSLRNIETPRQALRQDVQAKQIAAKLTTKEDLAYKWQMLKNVGHLPYWFVVCLVATALFILIKWLLIDFICRQLSYDPISQTRWEPIVLFIFVLLFNQITCLSHIAKIYGNSIVESMKPFKRTFDVVKVRIIKMATLGLEWEMLLVAIMLVYYGLISYYFIPRAVLYNQDELQTLQFNSIFFFMILGATTLCTVVQSYLEIILLKLLTYILPSMKSLKSVLLKNLKAKKFTNLKISISIALIFAFVLFFASGVKMEVRLIQSFIMRALGADLVLKNNEIRFNVSKIEDFLNQHSNKVEYAWISSGVVYGDLDIRFVDSRNPDDDYSFDMRVTSPNFLSTTYYDYYVPESYWNNYTYSPLPNGVLNGFDSIYDGNVSRAGYDPNDTFKSIDPYNISAASTMSSTVYERRLPPKQQIINMAISSNLNKKIGGSPGLMYMLSVRNKSSDARFYIRTRITHVLKALPGFTMLNSKGFISSQQSQYLYEILKEKNTTVKPYKLFVRGIHNVSAVKDLAPSLLALSPLHTQLRLVSFVSESFSLLQFYLEWFMTLLTAVMNTLSVMLLFLYTRNKIREEMELDRILRAVGTPVDWLRLMVFCEVFVRVLVSITIGIVMGVVVSMAFASQMETLLMIRMPSFDLSLTLIMAFVLLCIFSLTVMFSTRHMKKMTVAQMARG